MSQAAGVVRFHEAFARQDAARMVACYHRSATFEDPAFGPTGLLLGWTPWFRDKVQAEALRALAAYRAKGSVR